MLIRWEKAEGSGLNLLMDAIWLLLSEYLDYSEQPAWAATCTLLSHQYEDKKRHDEEIWHLHQQMWEEGWFSD